MIDFDIDRDAIVQTFLDESEEGLAAMEEAMIGLEARPDDAELVSTIFRVAHTLKGNAASLGFEGLVRFAHAPGLVTSFFRMTIAAVVLTPIALRQVQRLGAFPPMRMLSLGLLAGLFSAVDHGLWSTALGTTSVANATLFNYIAPLWVALFAALAWRVIAG